MCLQRIFPERTTSVQQPLSGAELVCALLGRCEAGGRGVLRLKPPQPSPPSLNRPSILPMLPGYGAGIQARPKFLLLPEFTSWLSLPSARLALRSTPASQSAQYSRPAVTSMAIPCTVLFWLLTRVVALEPSRLAT